MGKVVAITNQKGGVGKTTTAINLSASLAKTNKKTLLIDADPQGNASSGVGIDKNKVEFALYDILLGNAYTNEGILETNIENLFLIPSNIALAGAEIELLEMENREFIVSNIISEIRDEYDFIIIDCPPSLNILTLNALTACDTVFIPIQCEYYALEGLSQLLQTIALVKKNFNPSLRIEGVVFTMYDSITNLSKQVVEEVEEFMGPLVFETKIPRNVRISEAPSHGVAVISYAPNSKGAKAYKSLAKEFLERNNIKA